MLTAYLRATMRKARYELLEDGSYYGEIPGFQGVFANAVTLEDCRDLLQEVLEGWLLLSFSRGLSVPKLEGIDLSVRAGDRS